MNLRPLDDFSARLPWSAIDNRYLGRLIALARDEDMGGEGLSAASGLRPEEPRDVTTALLPHMATGAARLVARRELVACGLDLVPRIAAIYGGGLAFEPACADGAVVPAGGVMGTLRGSVCTLLQAERVMLNFLQRLSGVASATRIYCEAMGDTPTRLLDTRKTTPGFRVLEKYAVACGGGWNHRLGLFDRVMIKDNHLAAAGATGGNALSRAVRKAVATYPHIVVEVEVDRMEQITPVIDAGAHIVLLDNFPVDALEAAVALIAGRARTEASGGVTLDKLPAICRTGVDFVSTGALTHASTWMDIGLDWE